VKNTDIDNLYSSLESILEDMGKTNPTACNLLGDLLSRAIIIAAVSEFEVRITNAIGNMKVDNIKIKELVKMFMVRQFWNMFSFNGNKNINHFLSYFGKDFEESVSKEIDNNNELKQDLEYFIELVELRNVLSHKGFLITFNIPMTYNESFDRYKKAKNIVDFMEHKLLE